MTEVFDGLRKRARATENSIDVKLVSLNKLNINLHGDMTTVDARQSLYDSITQEIEALLAKLAAINDEMHDVVDKDLSHGSAQNPAVQHTLRRHHEILRDYGAEYQRTKSNVLHQLQRQLLLSSSSTNDATCRNNRVKGSDMYLKESDHISSCDRLLDDHISIAISTKENLKQQSISLRGITKKMDSIAKKYPMVNSIMKKIQYKKRKDKVIMAAVISVCLIFLIVFMMHQMISFVLPLKQCVYFHLTPPGVF